MDFKEKLEIVADIASDNAVFDSNPWNVFNDGFIKGAEWLQSQPIVDRLTKWEREKIMEMYADLIPLKGHMAGIVGQMVLLEKIFGKEMFEK